MRGVSQSFGRLLACAAVLVSGCSGHPEAAKAETDVERGKRYDESESFRRDALVASLQNPDNGYSRLRLERYRPERWEALPIWDPAIRPVSEADVGGPKPAAGFTALEIDAVPWEEAP